MISHPLAAHNPPSAGCAPPFGAVGSSPTIFEVAKPALQGGLREWIAQNVGAGAARTARHLDHHPGLVWGLLTCVQV